MHVGWMTTSVARVTSTAPVARLVHSREQLAVFASRAAFVTRSA